MNCLNAIGSGINNKNVNNSFTVQYNTFSILFNTPLDSQFFNQTTPDNLYDVYTIVGQYGTDTTPPFIQCNDKTVIATFTITTPKTIQYVCVGGGGYTYNNGGVCGGGGAGAYYEGSLLVNSNVSLTFVAGGSYKPSTITSSILNVIAGNGGYSNLNTNPRSENGNNGSSGGGSTTNNASTPGTGNPPGNNGGTGYASATRRSGGGGGGAGGAGGNGTTTGYRGEGGIGKIPTSAGINAIYKTPLCVGGAGQGSVDSVGNKNTSYGSGSSTTTGDGTFRYGMPGAIIIAVPKT